MLLPTWETYELGQLVHDSATNRTGVVVTRPYEPVSDAAYRLRPPGGGEGWNAPGDGTTLTPVTGAGILPRQVSLANHALEDLLLRALGGRLLTIDEADVITEELTGSLMLMLPVVEDYVRLLPHETTAYIQADAMLRVAARVLHHPPSGHGTTVANQQMRLLAKSLRQLASYYSAIPAGPQDGAP